MKISSELFQSSSRMPGGEIASRSFMYSSAFRPASLSTPTAISRGSMSPSDQSERPRGKRSTAPPRRMQFAADLENVREGLGVRETCFFDQVASHGEQLYRRERRHRLLPPLPPSGRPDPRIEIQAVYAAVVEKGFRATNAACLDELSQPGD